MTRSQGTDQTSHALSEYTRRALLSIAAAVVGANQAALPLSTSWSLIAAPSYKSQKHHPGSLFAWNGVEVSNDLEQCANILYITVNVTKGEAVASRQQLA